MAKQGYNNQIKGAIGPVIYQPRYGKTIIRSMPDKVRQTSATKSSSSEFQYCSKWSKFLRLGLKPLWLDNADSLISQKLTAALYAALQRNTTLPKGERNWSNTNLTGISGFEVNSQSLFENFCKVPIEAELTASRTIKITIPEGMPAQDIRYPESCTDAELVLCITATNINSGALLTTVAQHFAMPKSSVPLGIQIFESEPLPTDSIIVVAMQLVYYDSNVVNGRFSLNTKKLNPGTLLWVGV
jgi:hypothetical protein